MSTLRTRTFGLGGGGRPPLDLIVLLAVIFVTYSLTSFTSALEVFRLSSQVWQRGFVWQLVTYPWIGFPSANPSVWILLELFILYSFGSAIYARLGRRPFRELLAVSVIGAGVVTILVDLAMQLTLGGGGAAFSLLQGQRIFLVVFIAAFAVVHAQATVMLFFVLPVQASYFLWIELAFAFIAFLGSKDLAGFLGVCTAMAVTVGLLRPGGIRSLLREPRLRLERWWIERKLGRMRRRSKLRLVSDEDQKPGKKPDGGPWIH